MQKLSAAPFLVNHAPYLWRNKPLSLSKRQPACRDSQPRLKPQPQRSTADDIHAAKHAWKEHQQQKASNQNGDVPPGAADEATQQRLGRIEQEVLNELVPETNSDTSMHVGYDELMDIDHKPARSNDNPVHDISGKSANDAKNPVQSQSQDPRPALDYSDPRALWKHGTLLQKATVAVFTCVAGLVGLFLAWQVVKLTAKCVMSLAHIHTWLMIMGLTVTALITPQAPKINGLLRFVDEYNLFATYGQAKHTISITTWSSIAIFLVLVFFAGSIQ